MMANELKMAIGEIKNRFVLCTAQIRQWLTHSNPSADLRVAHGPSMQRQEPPTAFDRAHAAVYDERFSKLAPMRDALHLFISAIFVDLPVEARILCVGAGTGQELIYLAQKFPQWQFAIVEPSVPMLEVCRRKAEACGISRRCDFHEGYLESLPSTAAFDAATARRAPDLRHAQ